MYEEIRFVNGSLSEETDNHVLPQSVSKFHYLKTLLSGSGRVHMVPVTSVWVYVHLLHSLLSFELVYLAFSLCKWWTSLSRGLLDEILTADCNICVFSLKN